MGKIFHYKTLLYGVNYCRTTHIRDKLFERFVFYLAGTVEIPSVSESFLLESWEWDTFNKSPNAVLSQDHHAAYFHIDSINGSIGTAGEEVQHCSRLPKTFQTEHCLVLYCMVGVRGSKGFTEGEHYWEIRFCEPAWGTSVMIGIGTKDAVLHLENNQFVDLLGECSISYFTESLSSTSHSFLVIGFRN